MKKALSIILSLTVVITTMGGCSLKKDKTKENIKNLNIGIIYSDKDQGKIYKDIAHSYEVLNENKIKINIVTDYGDQDKIKTALTSSGDMDIIGLKRTQVIEYAKQGLLLDMESMLKSSDLTNKLYNISLAYGSYNGKNYGIGDLPMSMEWFYNPDILNKYGLGVPSNLTDLLRISKVIKRKGLIPIGLGAIDGFTISSVFGMITSGTTISSDFTNNYGSQMDAFRNIKGMNSAFNIFYKLAGAAILTNSDEINYRQSVQDFVNGKSAFLPVGSWATALIDQIKPSNFNYKCLSQNVALSENPTSLYSSSAGQVLTIANNSKNSDEAEKFIEYLMTSEAQKKFTESGYISSLKSANSTQNEVGMNILSHIEASDVNSLMLMDNIDSSMSDSLTSVLKDELAGRIKPGDAWNRVLKNTYKQ